MVDIVMGTCDGTGAAINVCLGFIPDKVEVYNCEGTQERLVWIKEMAVITSIEEGWSTQSNTDAFVADTGGGIDAYTGGDEIVYDGTTNNRWEDSAGTSKEEVYVNGHYKRTAAGDAAYQCIGDALEPNKNDGSKVKTPAGFTIGTLANLNVNGEQLVWVAYRCN